MVLVPDFTLQADMDRNGSWETDLSAYLNTRSGGLQTKRGMDPNGVYEVGEMSFALDNSSGDFSPEYPSGAYYGKLEPDIPIRLICTHNSIDYTLWTGYVESWKVRYGKLFESACEVSCADLAKYLLDSDPVNLAVSTSRDTDGAIQAVLDAIGLTGADYNLDDGFQDLPYSFAIGQEAMDAIMAFSRSEMGGLCWVTAAGVFRFENRQSRLGTSVDDTWGDGTNVQCERVDYELADTELVTSVTVRGTRYLTGQDGVEVFRWSLGKDSPSRFSLALTANVPYKRTFKLNAPAFAIYTATATTDYIANDNSDGSGTDRTSSLTVSYTLNGSGEVEISVTSTVTCYLTYLRVRGQTATFSADRPEYTVTTPIPGRKAGKSVNVDVPFADADNAKLRDFCFQLAHTYRWPYPRVALEFCWDHDDISVAMLSAEIGDLIAFADQAPSGNAAWVTNVEDWWYVERIEHTIAPAEIQRSRVTLIPSYLYRNLDAIIYDRFDRADTTSGLGTSTSGHAWMQTTFKIVSNKAVPTAGDNGQTYVTLASDDYVVELSLSNLDADADAICGITFGHLDSNNFNRWLINKYSGYMEWQDRKGGITFSSLYTLPTLGDTAELRVIVQNGRARFWLDRKLLADETVTNYGQHVGMFRNQTTVVTYDWFYAQGLN